MRRHGFQKDEEKQAMMWSLRCSFIHSSIPLADADSVVCGLGSEVGYRML